MMNGPTGTFAPGPGGTNGNGAGGSTASNGCACTVDTFADPGGLVGELNHPSKNPINVMVAASTVLSTVAIMNPPDATAEALVHVVVANALLLIIPNVEAGSAAAATGAAPRWIKDILG